MAARILSRKNRLPHLGPHSLEVLPRQSDIDLSSVPRFEPLSFTRPDEPQSIINAMGDHQAVLDAIRVGLVNPVMAELPEDPIERANHLKSFGYFQDASMVGVCALPQAARLSEPYVNPRIAALAKDLQTREVKSVAPGFDKIMADLKDSMAATPGAVDTHTHAVVFLYETARDPDKGETGADWLHGASRHRAALVATETVAVLADYLRLYGVDARGHSATTSDVDLNMLAVAAGLAYVNDGVVVAPFVGAGYALAAVTTTLAMAPDLPLAPVQPALRYERRYAKRRFKDGAHPFETIKRVDTPTTFIDEDRVPRVPKRSDMFVRAQFGDLGDKVQNVSIGGYHTLKSAMASAQRRALGALLFLQDGPVAHERMELSPQVAHDLVKATTYFMGIDAAGISRCPEWVWYSHDALGDEIVPDHDQAISMIVDQGYETMDGSSGDDWISVSLSMRAYLRFSLLGGVVARQLRNIGYGARAHTTMDGGVLNPPLLLLSGLGEVSRIGEVILNPYLGPRLKSGVVTTELPMAHDKPIDFGLQSFCEACKKCARECPSGAITAGPKLMFNGYEIWKSDAQKCATYRMTNLGGAMCGRCMKTCPWNLEGVLGDAVFRWTAMKVPGSAPALAKLDDLLNRGDLNEKKQWWWDLCLAEDGGFRMTDAPVHKRGLQKDLDLKYEDQTLACYPANLAPPPYAYPFPIDREKGIEAFQQMVTPDEYQKRLAAGETDGLVKPFEITEASPVLALEIAEVTSTADGISCFVFRDPQGHNLPEWTAGAHLDVVVTPEFFRQYSLCGDPADRSRYQIGVLREAEGRGGSKMLHRVFSEGRRVFVSHPANHFPLDEGASKVFLMGGGIGITPMIAMAHRLHALGRAFELHYSGRARAKMGFLDTLADAPWSEHVTLHVSEEGQRADLSNILTYSDGAHVYTCGPEPYIRAVLDTAEAAGFPEANRHFEYFTVPETPEYQNHEFTVALAASGRELTVPADKSLSDVLLENGVKLDIKCADGICGVCKCSLVDGDVEHRDFVLSNAQRETEIITCQSRAATPGGRITLDL